jgi:hypothetical protein
MTVAIAPGTGPPSGVGLAFPSGGPLTTHARDGRESARQRQSRRTRRLPAEFTARACVRWKLWLATLDNTPRRALARPAHNPRPQLCRPPGDAAGPSSAEHSAWPGGGGGRRACRPASRGGWTAGRLAGPTTRHRWPGSGQLAADARRSRPQTRTKAAGRRVALNQQQRRAPATAIGCGYPAPRRRGPASPPAKTADAPRTRNRAAGAPANRRTCPVATLTPSAPRPGTLCYGRSASVPRGLVTASAHLRSAPPVR